jgi:hypothetical protein
MRLTRDEEALDACTRLMKVERVFVLSAQQAFTLLLKLGRKRSPSPIRRLPASGGMVTSGR